MHNYQFSFIKMMADRDFIEALLEGDLLEGFVPKNRYDELFHETVIGFISYNPLFTEWRDTVTPVKGIAYRKGDEVPIVPTGYNLSIHEVAGMKHDPNIMFRFMLSMSHALKDKRLPYEEIFACIMDAIYTSDYVLANNLHSVH